MRSRPAASRRDAVIDGYGSALDPYTGDVRVGGPPAVRRLPGLEVRKIAVGGMNNNAYLLSDPATGCVLMIDAAAEPDRLLEAVDGGRLERIVETHRHRDHWEALEAVVAATGVPVAAHEADADSFPVRVTERLSDGSTIRVGGATLTAIHLDGHTPGGLALLYDANGELADAPHVFTGDSLFPGGVGRTMNPDDFTRLLDDVEHKLFGQLPDATWVYPGHGADTTLGAERPHLLEWRNRGW